MSHIPLSPDDWKLLYEAQLRSLQQGDLYLAGTRQLTAERGWQVLDGLVVRDDSGEEARFFRDQQRNQH
jgi:hypothetical protein